MENLQKQLTISSLESLVNMLDAQKSASENILKQATKNTDLSKAYSQGYSDASNQALLMAKAILNSLK